MEASEARPAWRIEARSYVELRSIDLYQQSNAIDPNSTQRTVFIPLPAQSLLCRNDISPISARCFALELVTSKDLCVLYDGLVSIEEQSDSRILSNLGWECLRGRSNISGLIAILGRRLIEAFLGVVESLQLLFLAADYGGE